MVLLTSSQVGIALSSIIIFLCTSALFLSGYVLQQKTVNDIRLAIKPQLISSKGGLKTPSYLGQPRFRDQELWNGKEAEIVVVEETRKVQDEEEGGGDGDESMVGATRWQKAAKLREKERAKEEAARMVEEREREEAEVASLSRAARRKKIKEEIVAGGGEGFKGYQRRRW